MLDNHIDKCLAGNEKKQSASTTVESTQGERPLDSPSPIRGSLSSFTQSTPIKQEKKLEVADSPAKRTRRLERIPLAERMRPTEFEEIMVRRCNTLSDRETLMSLEKRRQCGHSSSGILPHRSFFSDLLDVGRRRLPPSSPTTHPVRSAHSRAARQASRTSERWPPRPPRTDRRGACRRFSSWTKSTASTRNNKTSFSRTSNRVCWCSSARRPKTPPSPSTTYSLSLPLSQALLSRCQVVPLKLLSVADLEAILRRALASDVFLQRSGVLFSLPFHPRPPSATPRCACWRQKPTATRAWR